VKKSIVIAIMFAGIGVSTPSFADRGACDNDRGHGLEARLAEDVHDGRVDEGEGRDLHAKIYSVQRLQVHYCRQGLNDWQAHDLDQHYERVANEIAVAEGRRPGWRRH
jgi:hypothetical protein